MPDADPSVLDLNTEIAGLDALESDERVDEPTALSRLWSTVWPKLGAAAIGLGLWQLVVWSGWRPTYVLPGPGTVFRRLARDLADGSLPRAVTVTMARAFAGYGLAVLVGG